MFGDASITACNHMFPMYFAGAIQRNSKLGGISVAAVSMKFPGIESKVFLTVHVTPNKVEHIAWKLFQVRLEHEGGSRYIYTEPARVVPAPQFGLRCCCIQAIPDIFGEYLAGAIYNNPKYQQERLEEYNYTKSISMLVPSAADKCAQIFVSLHPREGMMVKEKLFPSA
jgi:hypothetical protein